MKEKRKFTTERAGKEIRNFYETIKDKLYNGKVVAELFDYSDGEKVAMVTAIIIEGETFYALWELGLGRVWSLYYIGEHDKIQQKWNEVYNYWNP